MTILRWVVTGGALVAASLAAAGPGSMRPASSGIAPTTHTDSLRPGPDSVRVARLLDALGTTDPVICELIGDQLGNFWSGEGREGVGRFADAPPAIQLTKDSLAGRVRESRAIRMLVSRLDYPQPCVRRVAAKLLGNSTVGSEELVRLMGSTVPRIREAAAYAAGSGERKEARAALARALREQPGSEAAMDAWALGELQDTASLADLARATQATDAHLRLAAVWALGNLEDPRAVPQLERSLADDSPPVRYAAAAGFSNMHDLRRAPAALARAAQSTDARLRRLAARALAEIHDPTTVEVLISLVGIDDQDVRRAVVEGLGEIKSPRSIPALLKALKDPDASVRKAAAEALGEIKSSGASGPAE